MLELRVTLCVCVCAHIRECGYLNKLCVYVRVVYRGMWFPRWGVLRVLQSDSWRANLSSGSPSDGRADKRPPRTRPLPLCPNTHAHTHTGSPGAARSRGLTARHSRLSMGSAKGGEERPEGGAKGLEVAVIAAKARLTAKRERESVSRYTSQVLNSH